MARWWSGKTCRLISMLTLTFTYFLVELIVGHITGSLALVADSFHMLSDVVALIVGIISVMFARRGTSKSNTFGWARAEVLGAMVNAVFLVALCFTILVEAVQRLISPEKIDDPVFLLIVGGIGLLVNLIGLALFHNQAHGHSHGGGGHGHSHGGHGHSHSKKSKKGSAKSHEEAPLKTVVLCEDLDGANGTEVDSEDEISVGMVPQHDGSVKEVKLKKDKTEASAQQLNMRGVFLHVLGDALGSVVVMISATISLTVPRVEMCDIKDHSYPVCSFINATTTALLSNISGGSCDLSNVKNISEICSEQEPIWVQYIDPVLSILLVAIILSTSIPLLKQSGSILLQTVPTHIVVSKMQEDLEEMDGILAVHEFHVWSLAGNRIVASLHLHIRSLDDYIRVSNQVKEYFHDEGIHSVTIQPEFLDLHVKKAGRDCVLECGPEKDCHSDTCCAKKASNGEAKSGAVDGARQMDRVNGEQRV